MNVSLICSPADPFITRVPFYYSSKTRAEYVLDALNLESEEKNISTTALIVMCGLGIVGLSIFALETALVTLAILGR